MTQTAAPDARKAELRGVLRAARRARADEDRSAAAVSIADAVLSLDEVLRAGTVTAYLSRPDEPGTGPLLDALVARGTRILLPVLMDDLGLDWAEYEGPDALQPSGVRGNTSLLEPRGPSLGPTAIGAADVVLAPGLAVGSDGSRLGHGGGCYDRALTHVAAGTPVVAIVFDSELLDSAVPTEAHDRRVSAVATERRTVRFG